MTEVASSSSYSSSSSPSVSVASISAWCHQPLSRVIAPQPIFRLSSKSSSNDNNTANRNEADRVSHDGAFPSVDSLSTPSSSSPTAVSSPPIDRALFDSEETVLALRVEVKRCGTIFKHFKLRTDCPWLLQRPRITPIIDDPNSREHKYILLAFTSMSELSSTLPPETLSLLVQEKAVPVLFTHKLTYEYHTADYCLRKLLPAHIQIPSGFETVGHIAHLNLSEEQRPYGKLIAKVLLDKSPQLRTIVNKVGQISNAYRVFDMEVLGGVNSMQTQVREHGCVFNFDFSRVYWNSRLSSEHTRVMQLFQPGQLIVDMMCGIGPFVIPAAKSLAHAAALEANKKKGASLKSSPDSFSSTVASSSSPSLPSASAAAPASPPLIWANDLNPSSYQSLVENIRTNKVTSYISAHNMDGRDFIRSVIRPAQLSRKGQLYKKPISHLVMNLPAIAIEFLDAFVGIYAKQPEEDALIEEFEEDSLQYLASSGTVDPATASASASSSSSSTAASSSPCTPPLSPLVHVYCFTHFVSDPLSDLVPRVERALQGHKIPKAQLLAHSSGNAPSELKDSRKQGKKKQEHDSSAMQIEDHSSSSSGSPSPLPSSASLLPGTAPAPALDVTYVRFVRNVAPNKDMFCISFHIPNSALIDASQAGREWTKHFIPTTAAKPPHLTDAANAGAETEDEAGAAAQHEPQNGGGKRKAANSTDEASASANQTASSAVEELDPSVTKKFKA